ncbi:unnamed protein product [Cylicocyclus nassatus]|uniref:Uncharacterized protein n=1 Tax=Cylicocyclus nassatus TaxID=53992 RepID=A0AA36GQI2_CYLNA|nr:unnamed protein product [Cylicocyclus nassatus]
MSKLENVDLIVQEVDALYDNYLIDNAYSILRRLAKSDCSELLWRLAQGACEQAKLSTNTYYIAEVHERMGNKDEALKYYLEAFKMPVITADDKQIHEKVIIIFSSIEPQSSST